MFITTVGCGGTSWIVKFLLTFIVGKTSFADYEMADKRICEEKEIPFLLIRPYALSNEIGKGSYYVTRKQKGTFLKKYLVMT